MATISAISDAISTASYPSPSNSAPLHRRDASTLTLLRLPSPSSLPSPLRLRHAAGTNLPLQGRCLAPIAPRSAAAPAPALPNVLVAEKLSDGGLALLRQAANVECCYNMSPEELCAKISLCDALIVRSGTIVSREALEAGKGRLKVVGRAGVGIDNVDLQAATELGCLVVNAPTANTIAAAEHAIALLLAMARNVPAANAALKAGKWQRSKYTGVSLVGKTISVIGFGKVGSEVARRCKGLGLTVLAHDPYAAADRARAMGIDLVSFDEALARSDFLSLHMPLTPSTSKLFDSAAFAKAKRGVRIVNVARGGVIDEEALIEALDSGIVAQAALDVFTVEPPPSDSKLLTNEHIVVTPHLGASTIEAQEDVAVEIAEAVIGALQGEFAATAVNAPMVPKAVLAELAPYISLAEKLGKLAIQLVSGGGGASDVTISFSSSRADDDLDTRVLRAMIIKGFVEPVSSAYVNLVNADLIAKQRGLKITEERRLTDNLYEAPLETIEVRVSHARSKFASAMSDSGEITLEGKVKDGIPYLSRVGDFDVDVSVEGSLVLCRQEDQPGMIGKVGSIMGEDNVNISFMSVGRTAPREHALMAIGIDEEPSKDALKKIECLPAIEELVYLKL